MGKGKRSFFERLTGTVSLEDYDDDSFEDEVVHDPARRSEPRYQESENAHESMALESEPTEGQLSVDVYQTPTHIVIKAHVAGVRPDDLDISITRDMVIIKGKREEARETSGDDYFFKELYWGSFSRTILLPQEIEVEEAEATEKHGLLTLKLPKIDKEKQTKLKVKGN